MASKRSRKPGGSLSLLACALSIAALSLLMPTRADARCGDRPAEQVDWSGCRKSNLSLTAMALSRSLMVKAHLVGTDFSEANLEGSDLTKAELSNAWFIKAKLKKVALTGAFGTRMRFTGADLTGADLGKVEFSRAEFKGADMRGANLQGAQLVRSILADANLAGSNLAAANLARAVLAGADLAGSDLTDAYLYLARLEKTDLSAAKGLTAGQIAIACGDASTKLPAGITAPATWPCPAP